MSLLKNIKKFWNTNSLSEITEIFNVVYVILSSVIWIAGAIIIARHSGSKENRWALFGQLLIFSAAAYILGLLIGFLFGIPKTLQNTKNTDNSPLGDILITNTNLEQISDWLTKIIVGLGLVNLRKVPIYMEQLRQTFQTALPEKTNAAVSYSVVAICIYASITAFITMYIYTRINISSVFMQKSISEKQLVSGLIDDMAKQPEKVKNLVNAVNQPGYEMLKTTLKAGLDN